MNNNNENNDNNDDENRTIIDGKFVFYIKFANLLSFY